MKDGSARRYSFSFLVSRVPLFLAALVCLAALNACGLFKPQSPSQPLSVTGYGRASAEEAAQIDETDQADRGGRDSGGPGWWPFGKGRSKKGPGPFGKDYPDWATQYIEARSTSDISDEATSRIEALMVARRDAADRALRQIADGVLKLPDYSGAPIQNLLSADEDLRTRIEDTIRTRCSIRVEEQDRGKRCEVLARLDLELVARQIWGGGPDAGAAPGARREKPRRLGPGVRVPEDPVRLLAFERAERDARLKLLDRLKRISLSSNYTLQDHMAANPRAAQTIHDAVEDATVARCAYPGPGLCELSLLLDMEPLFEKLRK